MRLLWFVFVLPASVVATYWIFIKPVYSASRVWGELASSYRAHEEPLVEVWRRDRVYFRRLFEDSASPLKPIWNIMAGGYYRGGKTGYGANAQGIVVKAVGRKQTLFIPWAHLTGRLAYRRVGPHDDAPSRCCTRCAEGLR